MRLSTGWTITGKYGFYWDSFSRTRKAAIEGHAAALGRTWVYCRAKGDRCIKTELRKVTR